MAFATAFAMLGNRQLAEDVAQEAFMEAYVNLAKLEVPDAFPGWLRTIITRQVSRITRRKSLTTISIEHASDVSVTSADLVSVMAERELQEQIHQVIESLPERERQVILLYYIGDYSQREIADYLDVRVSTVKSRLHTARS